MRASIRQVAERAQVSPVTVSNVLRGLDNRASEETRRRVMRAVRELNYVPVSQPAMQKRRVETKVLGVVLHRQDEPRHVFAVPTLSGIADEAAAHGYDVLLLFRTKPAWAPTGDEAAFMDRRSDGLIFLHRPDLRATLDKIAANGIPTVACFSSDVPEGVVSIVPDNAMAMRLAVTHLAEHGHRKIAFLNGPRNHSDARDRAAGFVAAMKGAGLHEWAGRSTWGEWFSDPAENLNRNRAAIQALLSHEPTALICGNDAQAVAVLSVCRERGLRVPEDLSIVGIDDLPHAAEHGLTTVALPFSEIGQAAAIALLALINGGDAAERSAVLPVRLVQRRSVAVPNG